MFHGERGCLVLEHVFDVHQQSSKFKCATKLASHGQRWVKGPLVQALAWHKEFCPDAGSFSESLNMFDIPVDVGIGLRISEALALLEPF